MGPVVAGTIVATVAMPLVGVLERHMPRAAAAGIVLLGVAAIGVFVLVIVIGGITAQRSSISEHATSASNKAEGWLNDLGVDKSGSSGAKSSVEQSVPKIISTLTKGVISGIQGLTSLAFALSFTLLSLFFLLKDGPSMRRWVDGHLGLPPPVAQLVTGGVIRSLRGYFRGVTLVAAFNGVVVGLAAWALGVPLAGTIAVVTFVTAYVPFIGAFVAGAFAVVIALGAKGTTIALVMLLIVILANGAAPEHRPAVRDGLGARPAPARGAGAHDRGGLHLRDDRAGARGAACLGGRPHHARPGPGARDCGFAGTSGRSSRRGPTSRPCLVAFLPGITRFGRCPDHGAGATLVRSYAKELDVNDELGASFWWKLIGLVFLCGLGGILLFLLGGRGVVPMGRDRRPGVLLPHRSRLRRHLRPAKAEAVRRGREAVRRPGLERGGLRVFGKRRSGRWSCAADEADLTRSGDRLAAARDSELAVDGDRLRLDRVA